MRICAGITYMVLGEAPDMSSVDDEVRQHWNSLSIETARRKPMRQTPLDQRARIELMWKQKFCDENNPVRKPSLGPPRRERCLDALGTRRAICHANLQGK